MRFHVVGVGAVGSLLAFHLKRSSRRLLAATAATLPGLGGNSGTSGTSGSDRSDEAQRYLRSLPAPHALPYLPPPHEQGIVLRMRKFAYASRAIRRSDASVAVQRDDVWDKETAFAVIHDGDDYSGIPSSTEPGTKLPRDSESQTVEWGRSYCQQAGFGTEEAIDSIIVATKAQNVLGALQPISQHITRATTIVLVQNGQGVLDLLLERLFQNPETRPNFILASNTHGVFRKGQLHVLHTAFGRLDFGIVPNAYTGNDYEKLLAKQNDGEGDRSGQGEDEKKEEGQGRGIRAEDGSDSEGSRQNEWEAFLPKSAQARRRIERARERSAGIPNAPLLDVGAIPDLPETQTLRATVAMLLNLPLDVHWHPIRGLQMIALRKLAVNACINPLTALSEVENGQLLGNGSAEEAMRDVCTEASQVLEAQILRSHHAALARDTEREAGQEGGEEQANEDVRDLMLTPTSLPGYSSQTGVPALDPSLRAGALLAEAKRVARLTARNKSSMLQDVMNGAKTTEIQFINGYLSRLGRSFGIPTPVNDLLVKLVNFKISKNSAPGARSRYPRSGL
ncbi:hypothetical protein FA10DRAFT_269454 [Acaromyces ingoldii]|uniref:2-dehydropantoate 2-reductase n=1 Tax=Acaromyces ingoldii TaxID=215250 RepID=A0A316YEG1_9BASI|nr:hypothetical protein FA10DRAFT_269454 [Acaromyces ingoldii]PWN87501.1 hypothetical protein FA10DRAFT_269454 [Acaromyces ingoldii]